VTYPDDMLEGLDATPEERLAFLRALDEVEAEEAGIADPDYSEDGPWHDEAALLGEIGAQVDDHVATAAAVAAGDAEDAEWHTRRPSSEDKLARAIGRIEDGSYTPPAYFRPARDVRGRFGHACGQADPLGHCMERYHQVGCEDAVASSAASGSYEAVEAWNETVTSHIHPPEIYGLASPSTPEPGDGTDLWSDLLHSGEPGPDTDVRAWVLHRMGEADQPPPEPRPDLPDVTVLRATLGI
jgi:hypothetical protein